MIRPTPRRGIAWSNDLVSYSRTKSAKCHPSLPTGKSSPLEWVDERIRPSAARMAFNEGVGHERI